jgi:gamma-glutamylcyclotransferase (GGCT)/AIG2-like uncharacterized protein YtfP
MSEILFVYGTLRRQAPAHGLLVGSRLLSKGSVRGVLYDLGEYPGLVQDRANGNRVVGELYELPEGAAPSILRDLDRYEGDEFTRRKVFVTLPSGRRRAAWTYVLRTTPARARKIASGRYPSRRGAA